MPDDPLQSLDNLNGDAPHLVTGSDVELARLLCHTLCAEFGRVVYSEGQVWHYEQTHWRALADNKIRRIVHNFDGWRIENSNRGVSLGKSRIDSIINEAKVELEEEAFFRSPSSGINTLSGLLCFDAKGNIVVEPHCLDHRKRHVIASSWKPGLPERPPQESLLWKLLRGAFKGDHDMDEKIWLIAELLGATALGIATKLVNPKAIVLKGVRAENGKSQILDLLRGMLPAAAITSLSPAQFSDEKHAIKLAGVLLNACDELGSTEAIKSDRFKSIITGESITGRDVYRQSTTIYPQALHTLATNRLPPFKGGMDRGVRRRLIVIEFNRVVPKDERVEQIGQKISTNEADLVLALAVGGASRLIRQGHFTEPESGKSALRAWVLDTDAVVSWVEEGKLAEMFERNGEKVKTKDAYGEFGEWASEEGVPKNRIPAKATFTSRVREHVDTIDVVRTKAGTNFVDISKLV